MLFCCSREDSIDDVFYSNGSRAGRWLTLANLRIREGL